MTSFFRHLREFRKSDSSVISDCFNRIAELEIKAEKVNNLLANDQRLPPFKMKQIILDNDEPMTREGIIDLMKRACSLGAPVKFELSEKHAQDLTKLARKSTPSSLIKESVVLFDSIESVHVHLTDDRTAITIQD